MVWQRLGRTGWIGTAAVVAALAACTPQPPVEPTLKPIARPDTPPAPPPVVAKPTSQKSAKLRSYFNQVQQAQLSQGIAAPGWWGAGHALYRRHAGAQL